MLLNRIALCLSILFSITACNSKKENSAAPPAKPAAAPVAADVVICKSTMLNAELELNGTVVANDFVELRAEMPGRLVTLNLKEGSMVGKDVLIAKLYDDDLQAQLRKNQAQLNIAQANEQRLKKLLDINGINQQEYDQVAAQVAALLADIDFTKAQIRKTEIRTPFAGRIGLRNVSIGAYLSPQTIVTTLQGNNSMKVDFNTPENYANLTKVGQAINVIIEGKNSPIRGIIQAIEPQINQTTRNLKVRASLASNDVQAGAFAKILLAQVARNTISIPTNAIIPDTRNKKVFVLKNGKAQSVIVETGVRQKDVVEIISGLNVGDTVAVSGLLYLRADGIAKVKNVIQ
jgi:membrane fusion protein (multidrug efflux system)